MKKIIVLSLVASLGFLVSCKEGNAVKKVSKANLKQAKKRDSDISKGAPVIKFDKTVYDFGTVTEGEVIETAFTLTNVGKSALIITNAKTILWNGPLGYYEAGFDKGSKRLAELVGASESYSIAGGGDTIDAIYDAGQEDNFTFLSSAGGAMIDYLADGDLPGVNVLLSTPKE